MVSSILSKPLAPEALEKAAGIYVHIPYCRIKCPYCSFVSYQNVEAEIKKGYMQALAIQARDMARHPWTGSRKFRSLYIGGGTPSTIESSSMADFVATCLDLFDFTAEPGQEPEVTMEVNPQSASKKFLEKMRQAGVNRLSIGTQSFSDNMLKGIGRAHTVRDNVKAVGDARGAGFYNISLDLMYGLPDQDLKTWQNSLEEAIELVPEHLSVYELTIERNTPFASLAGQGKLNLPGEDMTASMFEMAQEFLASEGFVQYEISNYARRGFESTHNLNYWENGSYLGLGCGAVSCFSGLRIQNLEDPERYMQMMNSKQKPYKDGEFLSLSGRFRESVIMGLRMTDGVSVSRLKKRFGMTPSGHYGESLNTLIKQELLKEEHGRLHLTKRGLLLANRVLAQLV
jgi:oxygen-independent coproporphyrinogen-3 oxidase